MKKKSVFGFLFSLVFLTGGGTLIPSLTGSTPHYYENSEKYDNEITAQNQNLSVNDEVNRLNSALRAALTLYYTDPNNRLLLEKCRLLVDSIYQKITNTEIPSLTKSDSYYLLGIYYLTKGENPRAIDFLKSAVTFRQKVNVSDNGLARALYNLSVAYTGLGDIRKMEDYILSYVDLEQKLHGNSSAALFDSYSILSIAYIENQEYDKVQMYSNLALDIFEEKPDSISPKALADLYNNLGVSYHRMADFSKAKIYLDKSESICTINQLNSGGNYINLLNSMAVTYDALGLSEKAAGFYEKGIDLIKSINTSFSYNIINSYAIYLANSGRKAKGEALLSAATIRARKETGEYSRIYCEVLVNYAEYLREYNIDNNKSIEYFIECMEYTTRNPRDLGLKYAINTGYSLSLAKAGQTEKAVEILQTLLSSEYNIATGLGKYANPDIESIKSDKKSLKFFKAKYKLLWDIYKKTPDPKILETASGTSELIVSLLEKIRINISEEDSRLILGDRYRDSYFNVIRDLDLLNRKTPDQKYMEKIFEYSEKSKVAGLLTSTRELKAVQFHIPADIAEFELRLKRDIISLNARIAEKATGNHDDSVLVNSWNSKLLENTRLRDSLLLVFEQRYPAYYSLKYNTQVTSMDAIPGILGRNGNYLNYLLSDTILYIMVANRKFNHLISLHVDTSFFNSVKKFRRLLLMPSPSEDAVSALKNYQTTGMILYKTLIEPVRPYLISEKLIISPDNILSYIPFETIPVAVNTDGKSLYRNLSYLMNDFDISYTYSATFMSESVNLKKWKGFGNKVVTFAPNYPDPIDVKSVLLSRQPEGGVLLDLPYARLEAEYVSKITGGRLFENGGATETTYKAEAGKYDIIHLAMHTLLNDKDPMHSTLIFSRGSDSIDDNYLKTYEVYGIPLKAKMVVLSSCNTGTGFLSSGEGILSLARGFIYSGSKSVVMSMWEIEDKSGTEIVKMFYQNLKKGYSKSKALRKARIAYLGNADQLRSHPYFWSALIVYGNNTPLYIGRYMIILLVFGALLIVIPITFHFRKRRYS